jgi:hypothetical protein
VSDTFEKAVRDIVRVVQPSMADWRIESAGDIVVEMPPRSLTTAELIERSLVDGYEHYVQGDDVFINVGTIHLSRPKEHR